MYLLIPGWAFPPAGAIFGSAWPCFMPASGALTLAASAGFGAGAVFSGALDGHLRAYAATTGKILWDFDTDREFKTVNDVRAKGGSINGPAPTVAGGMLYVNSGDYRGIRGNVLLAFGVD